MKRKRLTGIATIAVLVAFSVLGIAMISDSESDAAGNDGDTVYEIKIVPGMTYTYTPAFSDALDVKVTIDSVSSGIDAKVSGGTLTVTVAKDTVYGTYDLILKAESENPYQCVYQHICFTVVAPLTVSGSVDDIVDGSKLTATFSATSGLTSDIEWKVTDGKTLPNGLSLKGNTVTGTPSDIGVQTISLTACTEYETACCELEFEVFSKINGGSSEKIVSIGGETCSSAAVPNDSRLGVVWTVAEGSLSDGFTLNPDTGEISGSSDVYVYETVTLKAVTTNGPSQTAEKEVTVCCERTLSIEVSSYTVVTSESAGERTVVFTPPGETGVISWSVSKAVGIRISDGVLHVKNTAESGNVIVTAETPFGQSASIVITIVKEAKVVISGGTTVETTVGHEAYTGFTSNIDGAWSVSGQLPDGVRAEMSEDGVLSIYGDCETEFSLTVSLSTEGGQTVSANVDCRIVAESVYKVGPTNGVAVRVVRS